MRARVSMWIAWNCGSICRCKSSIFFELFIENLVELLHLVGGEIQFLFKMGFGASFVEPAGVLKASRCATGNNKHPHRPARPPVLWSK